MKGKVQTDEFVGGKGLGFVAGRLQCGKMAILSDDEISLRRNRAVAEFVVVRVGRDHAKVVMGFDPADVAV